ncbi:hypothetical protein [Phenylobacterium sp.]|jgi:hypothetical protein|uniref:hypothetical protein n=1 Tax=Phenylobacterium sp. TaxID=1871053 RepID=UPI002F957DD5
MRPALALVATSILAGCATAPPPQPAGRWSLQASATAGAALVFSDETRIACRRNPPDLLVSAPNGPGTGGKVTLSVGRQTFDLQGEAGAPSLVATGPLPPGLPAALMSGGPVVIRAGGANLQMPPPDGKLAAAFAISCRSGPGLA